MSKQNEINEDFTYTDSQRETILAILGAGFSRVSTTTQAGMLKEECYFNDKGLRVDINYTYTDTPRRKPNV